MADHRRLSRDQTCYRIGDDRGAYPVWSAGGAMLNPGRWHGLGDPAIYAAEQYPTAMLEKLVHWNGLLPGGQHYVQATIPAGVSYEVFQPDAFPGWNGRVETVARGFGTQWFRERRSAVLFVPSVVAPMARNVIINDGHPEARQISLDLEVPVWWDDRLFPGRP